MVVSKFGLTRWVLLATTLAAVQACAKADPIGSQINESASQEAGAQGGSPSWSAGAGENAPSTGGGAVAEPAQPDAVAEPARPDAGVAPSALPDAGGDASGPKCSLTDLGNLLSTTDAGASVAVNCLLTTCLLDVIGEIGKCLDGCMQAHAGLSPSCGACVGQEVQAGRDQCLAQCADDFACYGDCALSTLGVAGEHCAL